MPEGFESDGYWFADLNLDGVLDVATHDYFTGETPCLFNDGARSRPIGDHQLQIRELHPQPARILIFSQLRG